MDNSLQIANTFRYIARYGLLIIGIAVFIAALVFGADLEKGISGIIKKQSKCIAVAGIIGIGFNFMEMGIAGWNFSDTVWNFFIVFF